MASILPEIEPVPIRVVKRVNDTMYRAILEPDQYTFNEIGQIILPDGYYSAGFYERVNEGSDWDELPWMN